MTDESNCGGCAGAGGVACASGETCTSGICCGPGETACNGVCVDLLTDNTHCGSCTTSCSGTTAVCNGGTCAGSCDPTETECNGDCTNTSNDPNHCGSCTTTCAANQVCSNSQCVTSCPTGTTNCNGACVNLTATPGDPNHCGSCTNVCAVGDECVAGQCQLDCPIGQELCNGACSNTKTDEMNCGGCAGSGGAICGTGQTCDDGLCCGTGQENVGGKCCNIGWLNCNGTCVDPDTNNSNCGACNAACGTGTTCDGGICCGTGLDNCNGTSCTNTQTDESNCGACNAPCAATETCTAGLCCDSVTEYNAGGICCPIGTVNCGGVCTNLNSAATCGTTCMNVGMCQPGEVCSGGTCTVNCTLPQVNCNGACVDRDTDELNCGTCGHVCASGQTCTGGVCGACPAGAPTECEAPINACVDPRIDNVNCGDCGTFCQAGEHCSTTSVKITSATESGTTATFTTATPHLFTVGQEVIVKNVTIAGYNGAWEVVAVPTTTTFTATLTASGLASATSQTTATVESGDCCGFGLEACNGQCLAFTSDPNNCGACGVTCGAGSVCVNGACECGFGQIKCGTNCITPSVDPLNCGACGSICGTGTNSGKPYCVSGGCTASCPSPLTGCGSGAAAECVNTDSDSDNCGGCGIKCTGTTGCSAGQCVPKVTVGTDPAKCVGGGPPISVPDDNGTVCTGSLGATSFTFGLCARTNIGPISRDLFTDAFDSTSGPYVASCTTDPDCGKKRCRITRELCTTIADCPVQIGNDCDYLVKCVGGTCAGGGVGANGMDDGPQVPVPVGPLASNSANTHVGGAFWAFGTIGLAVKGNTQVKQKFFNQANLDLSKTTHVWGEATVGGAWTSGGNTSMTIDKLLTVVTPTTCPPLPASVLTLNGTPAPGCTQAASFPALAQPCGTRAQLIDVKKIVRFYANPANNDNAAIGLQQDVLDNPQTSLRIDLPCGIYYFNSINAGKSITIVVHGRTAIIVGGAVRISQKVIFDVEPTASLDIFAGGVLNVSNDTTLGSPAYPRLTRFYLGDDSCKGGGGTLGTGEDFTDCCSGVASGTTCVAGGGNLAQSISLSQGGHFNGLLWGGYGTFTHSNPLEMYGSIFTNHFDASGDTIVHYDNGAVKLGEECPTPQGACESCRDCNNQACTNNQCGSCTADSQCCPPLVCRSGTCILE
jgi:hypothetical protein